MQGLRTKENNKFLKFFREAQNQAKGLESVFFLDYGECKDIDFDDMVIDVIAGWLVPDNEVESFENKFMNNENLDEFEELYIWCIPKIENNKLIVEFKRF